MTCGIVFIQYHEPTAPETAVRTAVQQYHLSKYPSLSARFCFLPPALDFGLDIMAFPFVVAYK